MGYVDARAYAELNDFLPPDLRGTTMRRPFRSHQTVKDVVEAVGIPHTEVDLILSGGASVGFSHRPAISDRIAVYPMFETLDIGPVGRLRPAPLRAPRFVVDVNLGRLARLLRLVGLDVQFDRHLDDAALAAISDTEHGWWGDAPWGALRDPPIDLVGSGLAGPTSRFFVRPEAAFVITRPSGESERSERTNEIEASAG